MPYTALPRTRCLEFARISLDRLEQIVDALVRSIGAHGDPGRIDVHHRDRRVVARRELRQAGPVQHGDLDRDHTQRITIGRCGSNCGMTHHAITTGAIDHIDRLPQFFFEQRTNDARDGIGSTACGPGNNQCDGTGGVIVSSKARNRDRKQ